MTTTFSKPICSLLNNCLSIYLRKRNEGEGCLTSPSIGKTLLKRKRIGSLEISYIEYCEVDETTKRRIDLGICPPYKGFILLFQANIR